MKEWQISDEEALSTPYMDPGLGISREGQPQTVRGWPPYKSYTYAARVSPPVNKTHLFVQVVAFRTLPDGEKEVYFMY